MPRPPVKKTRVLAKAQREGELKAQVEHDYKSVKWLADLIPFLPEKYKKNAVLWMKKIFEGHLAKIPKGIAILGMTYIIKNLIDTSEELRAKLPKVKIRFRVGPAFPTEFKPAWPLSLLTDEEEYEDFEGMFPDWADWLVAFTLAYMIVEHGGQIALGLGEAVKGLTGIVGFLLG